MEVMNPKRKFMSRSTVLSLLLWSSSDTTGCSFGMAFVPPVSYSHSLSQRSVQYETSFAVRAIHAMDASLHEDVRETSTTLDILICGGGPSGLLTSIMLAQKFPKSKIQVHDRQPSPPSTKDELIWGDTSKFYLIGLGGRGLSSLETFGVDVLPFAVPVPGRKDWTPEQPNGVELFRTDRKYGTQVLPRDKLVSILHEHVQEKYSDRIELNYQSIVRPVNFDYTVDGNQPKVLVEVTAAFGDEQMWSPVVADLVVASEGSTRTFANQIEALDKGKPDSFRVVRFEDDNVRVYKTLPFRLPELGWNITTPVPKTVFWNYAVRSPEGRVIFDALPANNQGDYVGVLLMRGDDEMAQPNVDPATFLSFLQDNIPQFLPLLDPQVIATAAKSGPSPLPQFRYVTPRMHQGKRTILLGDTAHTVKPFFGMGANSALEDVKIFGECIEESRGNLTEAIWNFSQRRSPDIAVLVQTSRDLDRPGVLGVFYFLIPVILDGIFQKLASQVFKPNIISMIQNEEYTFIEAVQRKQLDRIGQLVLLSAFFYLVTTATSSAYGVLTGLF